MVINDECFGWVQGDDNGSPEGGGGGGGVEELGPMGEEVEGAAEGVALGAAEAEADEARPPKRRMGSEGSSSLSCTMVRPPPPSRVATTSRRVLGGSSTSLSWGNRDSAEIRRARHVVSSMVNRHLSPTAPMKDFCTSMLEAHEEN